MKMKNKSQSQKLFQIHQIIVKIIKFKSKWSKGKKVEEW